MTDVQVLVSSMLTIAAFAFLQVVTVAFYVGCGYRSASGDTVWMKRLVCNSSSTVMVLEWTYLCLAPVNTTRSLRLLRSP